MDPMQIPMQGMSMQGGPMAPMPQLPQLPPQIVKLLLQMIVEQSQGQQRSASMPMDGGGPKRLPALLSPGRDNVGTDKAGEADVAYGTAFSQSSSGNAAMIDPTKRGLNPEDQAGARKASIWSRFSP